MQNHWQNPVAGAPPAMGSSAAIPGYRSVSAIEALKFGFSSPHWGSNLLLGSVFMLIPVVGPLALHGWECEIHQRLARRHPQPIPKLDFADFVHYLERGVGPFLVNLVIMMPTILVLYVFLIGGIVGGAAISKEAGEPTIALLFMLVLTLMIVPMSLFFFTLHNAGITRAELSEEIGASLSPGAQFAYGKRTWGRYFASSLVFGPLAFLMMLGGMMLCFIGLYPAVVAIRLGGAHQRWQIYEHQLAQGGEAIPLKHAVVIPSEARSQYAPYR
jgi:hypothetical protein